MYFLWILIFGEEILSMVFRKQFIEILISILFFVKSLSILLLIISVSRSWFIKRNHYKKNRLKKEETILDVTDPLCRCIKSMNKKNMIVKSIFL